jgi:hypothetical protein
MVDLLNRFQVRRQNELMSPGRCAVCGCISGEFIDFGLELDFFGNVYFCAKVCFRQAASVLGYLSPTAAKVLEDNDKNLRGENLILREEIGKLNDVVANLSSLNSSASIPVTPDLAMPSDPVEDTEESQRADESSNDESNGDEQGSPEQNDESGSSSVQHDDSLKDYLNDI